MGEKQTKPFQLSFNGLLKVDFQGSHVTSDGGLILVRELDERLGLGKLIDEYLSDSRQDLNKKFPLADLLRQSIYSRLAGYEDVNDAVRVSADPTFRLIGSQRNWDRRAALTSTLHGFETEMLASEENLLGLNWRSNRELGRARPPGRLAQLTPKTGQLRLEHGASTESPVQSEPFVGRQSPTTEDFESVCWNHPLLRDSPRYMRCILHSSRAVFTDEAWKTSEPRWHRMARVDSTPWSSFPRWTAWVVEASSQGFPRSCPLCHGRPGATDDNSASSNSWAFIEETNEIERQISHRHWRS